MPAINRFITSAESLITTHEETRAGFLNIALKKNRIGDPFVKNAFAFKTMVAHTHSPEDFLSMVEIRPFLVAAAGLSDKAQNHLNDEDKVIVIKELIDKFLLPAGDNYIDEAVFRYLLTKGDSVGGTIRNMIGELGQEKLIRAIFSCMDVRGTPCEKLSVGSKRWSGVNKSENGVEEKVKALRWSNSSGKRRLIFNINVPVVGKNVDICLYNDDGSHSSNSQISHLNEQAIMFGELKGGIDPAGADEHWKTGNTALNRIRTSFHDAGYPHILTSFIGAAIERSMADEIYAQLMNGTLSNAANLTKGDQLVEYCNWLIEL